LPKPLSWLPKCLKKLPFIGQGQKFEIWSDDIWNNKVNKWRSEETDESENLFYRILEFNEIR